MKKRIAVIISAVLIMGQSSLTFAASTAETEDTYTVDTTLICNAATVTPIGVYTYPSSQSVTYTLENTYGGEDIVGFEVDGRLVEGIHRDGNIMEYTFPKGTVGNHTLGAGNASDFPDGYYVQLQGFTWEYRNDSIAVGAAYHTQDANPQFKWEVYNLAKNEWTTIQDWSASNWVDWKGENGDYWLHCSMRSEDKLATTSQTMSFHYVAGNSQITGTYAGWAEDKILLGLTSGNPNATLQFKIYNLDTKQWIYLTDSKNKSNWITWSPEQGNYWVHYETYTVEGRLADTRTYCFAVNTPTIFTN